MTVLTYWSEQIKKEEMLIKTQIKITMLKNERDAVSSSHTDISVNIMQ